ncbi:MULTISPECIES: PPC domain-containing protein [unclassified Pseudoalteromonas]|uniref:PPC domain-containing protein n=1 Tax=unclassified Pseudoalteromonas TaxID=194690 RepID=UPI000694429D|nr:MULTISPECIES: PPC domain-containing protein [unclassified Pseudoalteromonas]
MEYTNAAKSKVKDINSLIDLAITETNTGYSNSGVNATVSLAHKAQVTYTEASNSSTDLTRLAATNDAYMDKLHTLRDQYAADVVVLVNDVNGYCGQADAIGANASSAFVIVDYDCATGYYSFGHGYQDPQSRWRTVMAYNCTSGCTRINYWSNPNKTYNGDLMGTTTKSDNARALNLTSPAMASFRTGVVLPPEVTALENNTAIAISGAKDSETSYTFSVPTGAYNISISTSTGTGDADIYVKRGSTASKSNYDCRPYESGNVENCPLTQSGEYSIMVSGYAAYSGVNLIGSYQLGGTTLPITVSESNLSDAKSGWKYFTVDAPANATSIKAVLSGGTGDADIYIRKGSQPTTSSYDCRSWNTGNSESCETAITTESTWHVGVNAYAAYTAANLEITVN